MFHSLEKQLIDYKYMADSIYAFRFKIEVVFAWLYTYKRILVRFELLSKNFKFCVFMVSVLINI